MYKPTVPVGVCGYCAGLWLGWMIRDLTNPITRAPLWEHSKRSVYIHYDTNSVQNLQIRKISRK